MSQKDEATSIDRQLKNPDSKYRPVPFWSWNDKLDTEMIRFQVQEMKKSGMGGFFMHARGGLETEYLSDEWMDAIKAGLDEAEKTGLHSWAYDEDGWPSGFAGGKVCDLGDRYHGRWLEHEIRSLSEKDFNGFGENSSLLGIYSIDEEHQSYALLTESDARKCLKSETSCLIISHRANPYYIDVLSEEVVGKFIDFTHEAYVNEMPEYFDGRFKGFFTDEPRLSGRSIDEDFPWSYTLESSYESEYGESLIARLPGLFFPDGDYKSLRYNYWKLVNHLFVHSFIKQLGDWCRQHNSGLTGHIMMEESISTQIANTGGVMPFYEFMDIPGIDWLRRTMSSPVVPKQVSSVAAQMNKKQVLTESFALCGWNAGFEDLKWVAQWQYVNGVNLLCQHLEGYTIRGLRKRDYPPSLFIQQPWWDQYSLFNTYFARLGFILSEGINPVDVLVLHPMRSGWLLFDGQFNSELSDLDSKFTGLLENLSGAQIEYHLGDETILSRHASVGDDGLTVGACTYRTVVIPEMLTLASSTLDLLESFLNGGGTVLCVNGFPALEEGRALQRNFGRFKNLISDISGSDDSLRNNIDAVLKLDQPGSTEGLSDIWITKRIFDDESYWYLININRNDGYDAELTVPDERELFLYDPVEHSYEPVDTILRNRERLAQLHFEPGRSIILVSSSKRKGYSYQDKKLIRNNLNIEGPWNLEMRDPNVLTMDRCRYRIDGGEWQDRIEVIHLFNKLLKMKKACTLAMEFEFESSLSGDNLNEVNLVVEMIEEFDVKVNGVTIKCEGSQWWKDSSFKTVDIRSYVVKGINTIHLERKFYQSEQVYHVLFGDNVYETEKNKLTFDVELENIYLTGDFSVISHAPFLPGGNGSLVTEGPFSLEKLPHTVNAENLTEEGFLFFSGKLEINKKIKIYKDDGIKYFLNLEGIKAALVKVQVNDQDVKNLLWAPWEADVSDYLKDGENKITLVLYGSNRNMLGPHHHKDGEPFNVGPGSFTGEWSWVEKQSEAVPATKEDRMKNYWDNRYAFVPFGLGTK